MNGYGPGGIPYGIGAEPIIGPGGIDGGGINPGGTGVFILGSNGIGTGGADATFGVDGISPTEYPLIKLGLFVDDASYLQFQIKITIYKK